MPQHATQRNPEDYLKEETYALTRAPVDEAVTLIADAYRCEQFFKLEQDRVFSTAWCPVAFTSEVEEIGQTIVREIAGQSILITRDKLGQSSSRCSALSAGSSGQAFSLSLSQLGLRLARPVYWHTVI